MSVPLVPGCTGVLFFGRLARDVAGWPCGHGGEAMEAVAVLRAYSDLIEELEAFPEADGCGAREHLRTEGGS